jgi:hypothetical protein
MSAIHWTYAEYLVSGSVPDGQTIILADSAAVLGALNPDDLAAMAAAGIAGIDATDDELIFTIAQLNALGLVSLAANDRVLIGDDPSLISLLSPVEIAALAMAGVDGIEVTHGGLALSLSQAQALGGIALVIDYSQWSDGSGVLDNIASGYRLEVSGVAVSDMADVQADPMVAGFLVADGAEAIADSLVALSAATKLLGIAVTDSTNLWITYEIYARGDRAMELLSAGVTLTLERNLIIWSR